MTKEDIIRMARESGFNVEQGFLLRVTGIDEDLERFAALVRADERGNQRQPLILNEMNAIEEYVYMQTTHKGKPSFEYAQALIRATEAAHNIGAKP